MTRKPGVGKTRHKWLLEDLDTNLNSAQTIINRILAELRAAQEQPGRRLADLAMLIAELAQTLSRARALIVAMQELIQEAPAPTEGDAIADLYALIADIQEQLDELKATAAASTSQITKSKPDPSAQQSQGGTTA